MNTKSYESQNAKNPNNNLSSHNNSIKSTLHPKVDLSKLDSSEETMSLYTYPKEFLKLDLDKIREFIDILEEHYKNLLDQNNITMAKSAKQRLILLKNLEKEKMKKEAKIIYSNQRELVQDKLTEELTAYIEKTDTEYNSLLEAFESQEVEMLKTQKKELDEFKNNFEKIYENKKPKPSRQILNWIKIRDYAVKQNKFDKVEEANKEIDKLQKKDDQKFEIDKQKKYNAEINKILKRHENEKNALQMKKNSITDLFNQTKNKNIDQIQKKYEAKMKELQNYQSFEMANFDKITKGITKPCARIQCIVSSTTGMREEENENENENENMNEENEIKGGEECDEEEEEGENKNENQNENNQKENENKNEEEEQENGQEENNEREEHENENEQGENYEGEGEEEEDGNEHQGFQYEEQEENVNDNYGD